MQALHFEWFSPNCFESHDERPNMNENTRNGFRALLNTDEDFRKAFLAAGSFERAVSLAAERNLAITIEDLKGLATQRPEIPEGPLSDAELEAVAGGKTVAGGKIMERYDQSAKNVIQSMRG